jgi:hypothetical protein
MPSKFAVSLELPEDKLSSALSNPDALRAVCKEEVTRFATYVNTVDPQFKKCPLAKEERAAIEGYLYQKVKGHIDQFHDKAPTI